MNNDSSSIQIGSLKIFPKIENGYLVSLGVWQVDETLLRCDTTRFLPWFDTYEGDVFRRFRFLVIERVGPATVIRTRAVSDPDTPFRERRDCSGDPCFRAVSWDAPALEADLNIWFEPVSDKIGGRDLRGVKYWFEYLGSAQVHRLIDRQTWELGGKLEDLTLCLRNWLTPPRFPLTKDGVYSTVGLDQWAGLLPGNLWGRWTLLPGFDMQYGKEGTLIGLFDQISLIRTVIETGAGENSLRVQDLHLFEQSGHFTTNPKSILFSPDILDELEALNFWTKLQDREYERACKQFGMKEEPPPAIVFSDNQWQKFRFASSYEKTVEIASEFGGDFVFIDGFWENGQALEETIRQFVPDEARPGTVLEKYLPSHMCITFDFQVAKIFGGEEGLKALVERAKARGVGILGWMSTHYHPQTVLNRKPELTYGQNGIFAAKESGRHPDTGYTSDCWPANLNGPILEKIRSQILGVCERTGLAGFLWDSFCNLGWWQVDYSKGDMRPQHDKAAGLYADLVNAGLFILPEALVSFSRHSCCGLHGGNVYDGDALGFSYNTQIALHYADASLGRADGVDWANLILKGEAPFDLLFRCFAHARIPGFCFHNVPRDQWNPESVTKIKRLFADYKRFRHLMQRRTVLREDKGVLWENQEGIPVVFAFKNQEWNGVVIEAQTIRSLSEEGSKSTC